MSAKNFSLVAGFNQSNYLSIDSGSRLYPINIGLAQSSQENNSDIPEEEAGERNTQIPFGISWEGDIIGQNLNLSNNLNLGGLITYKSDENIFSIYK
jgi:hypothetical protein